tara:strand:+ start:11090 stop:11980 length:891 start_codon:yes stop_codon:yes gene_type:complete
MGIDTIGTNALTDNSVTAPKIVDGVVASEIGTGEITTAKLADNAVTSLKIADAQVTSAKIYDGGITTAKLADDAVTSAKLAAGSVNPLALATDSVTSDKIVANAVTTSKINNDAVTSAKIVADAVESSEINSGAVGTGELANNAVTSDKIGANQVGSSELNTTDSYAFSGYIKSNNFIDAHVEITSDGTDTLNLSTANSFNIQLVNTTNTVVTFSSPPSLTNSAYVFMVKIKQPASGTTRSVTWTGGGGYNVRWKDGSPPTLSSGNSDEDIFVFVTQNPNAGTPTYYGMFAGKDLS